jgi:chromosome segregation ATPase
MNQPTREEIEEIKRRLARIERYTEPIQITRMEIESGSIFRRIDEVQEDMGVLKTQMEGVRGDVSIVKANQGDLKEYLEGQFKAIEDKQDAHQDLIGQLIGVGEGHTKSFTDVKERLSTIEKRLDTTATKDDISDLKSDFSDLKSDFSDLKTDFSDLKSDFSGLKAVQEKQMQILQVILDRLPPKQ